MSLFDTLVLNTACQFSSLTMESRNFGHTQAAPKLDILTVAKALYKLKYVLDKKLNTSKYFVFVQLETISKALPEQAKGSSNQIVLGRMVASFQCIYQRHYHASIKPDSFMQIVHYSDQELLHAGWQLRKLTGRKNNQDLLHSFQKMKEASRFFEMVDILQHTINQLVGSNTAQCLVVAIQALKKNRDTKLEDTHLLLGTPTDQTISKQDIEQQPCNPKPNDPSMSVDSIGSAFQIADMGSYQVSTPCKTQRSAVSNKRKVYLSSKQQHSRCGSQGNKQLIVRPSVPRFYLPEPIRQICIRLQTTIQLPHQETSSARHAKILHPDQLVKEVGDLLDNLSVFPWCELGSNCNSRQPSMVTSMHVDTTSHQAINPRKRTKVQPLTVSDKFYQNRVYSKQVIRPRQSQELAKTSKIFYKEPFNMAKSVKPSSHGQAHKKMGRKSVQNCNPIASSAKIINFLRNEVNPIRVPFKSFNSEVQASSGNTYLESKGKGRVSGNISSTASGTGDQNNQKLSQTQKIRKVSPISTIRQKLLTQFK